METFIREVKPDIMWFSGLLVPNKIHNAIRVGEKLGIPVVISPRGEASPDRMCLKGYKKYPYAAFVSILGIGTHVWICANSTILKGALISDNSVVGAGTIVSKKFEHRNVLIAGKNKIVMIACDISLNLFKSFTTLLPKKVVPSSRVGSYTMTVAPLALIRFMTPWILL